MKVEYKRNLQNNYLVLEAAQDENEAGYDIKMAEQNKIHGLLPMHSAKKDGKLYFHYEITSRQPLESLYEKKKMKSKEILLLFSSLNNILEEMQRYLLSPQYLVFDPELIYMEPDRKGIQLCYYPGGNYPVALLAEFLLKKLEHEDPRAVAIGYQFYQQAIGDNFSLTDTLREILKEEQRNREEDPPGYNGETKPDEKDAADRGFKERQKVSGPEMGEQENARIKGGEASTGDEYQVIHHERKPKSGSCVTAEKKGNKIAERVFSVVHPAVLLSVLILTIVLELLYASEVIGMTEAGGCFFLALSVGMLVNRFLLNRGKKKKVYHTGEDAEDDYRDLLEEMYAAGQDDKPEPVEETRCLVSPKQDEGLWLIYQGGNENGKNPPTIEIGRQPVCIGKIRSESEVVLDCGTVSRTHAKLERKGDSFVVQDLNSKNGTFLNGKRLLPQEEALLREGDYLTFAEVTYRVMRKGVWRMEEDPSGFRASAGRS